MAARDFGARRARGEFLAFLDADHAASPGWLRAALAAAQESTGLVQGRTLPDASRSLGILKRYVRLDAESFYYETSNIFYRKACFDRAGGFSDAIKPLKEWQRRAEAVLLAWRIKRDGWQTVFARDALAYSEVTPLPLRYWLFDNGLYRLPWVVRRIPELRAFFCARYFFDRPQVALILALSALPFVFAEPLFALLAVPYLVVRAMEPTQSLRGAMRLVRPLFYLPRDLVSLFLLAAGSIRYRTVLL
jgi:cellulose synthase/poly-beta-1,6-N-acetylglucosamine synthase-like glycosyltransferase